MKKYFYAIGIVTVAIFGVTGFAFALITCPAGSHTFSGSSQASSYDMCIPDIGPSGPVSSHSDQSSQTFTPSTKGTITPSGTTSQTQSQGIAIDTQVNSEVNRLYGTSIYASAKALYDNSISVNANDYNSVVNQVKNLDYDIADSLKRAYNVRAIERLNQVWNGIMALETTYAQQQRQQATTPTPITPTPITPTPITPTPITPTPITPTPITPTPITPTPITPTPITPTPITPTPVIAQYYDASNFVPGQTIDAPADQPANIVRHGQNIYMQAGSIIKYINQNTWQTVNGVFRFLEKTAIDGRYKIRTNGGPAVSVRGTQFIINETPNITTITLIKGALSVTPVQKGKPVVNLKEGYQLIITNGVLGRPTKFDANTLDIWYEALSPGLAFLDSSLVLEAAANRYRRESVYTAGSATPTETLTADEQKTVDAINQGLIIYHKKTTEVIIEKDKRYFSAVERTNLNGTVALQLYVDAKGIYYPAGKAGTWKTFPDKAKSNEIFNMVRQQNLTYGFDNDTFVFSNWEGTGKNRLAVYAGKLTGDGTNDIILSVTGAYQEAGQPVGTAKIYIDEESQLWTKAEVVVMIKSGKIIIPVQMIGNVTYGSIIKVTIPAKVKKVNAKIGNAELQKIISATR